jgi:hypothetical protein
MRIIDTLILPALLIACGVKLPDDQDPGDTSGEAASSSGDVSVSSTPTSGDESATDATARSAARDDGDWTARIPRGRPARARPAGGTRGWEHRVAAANPCEAMCEQAGLCELHSDVPACVAICLDTIDELGGACRAAVWEKTACFAELGCEALAKALAGEEGHPCLGAVLDQEAACGEPECDWGAGGDLRGSACSLFVQCPGDPEREMQCDTQTCTCLEDGVMTGSCAAEGGVRGPRRDPGARAGVLRVPGGRPVNWRLRGGRGRG